MQDVHQTYCQISQNAPVLSFSIRPDNHPVYPLHGWGGAARRPDCHHLPGKAVLLWLTTLPKIPPWIWLLPHCGEEGGTGHQHSQQHQYLHQYQHQHQQDASSQGQSCFSCTLIIQEKLVLHACLDAIGCWQFGIICSHLCLVIIFIYYI